jgi:hypothetical protein
MKVVHLWYDCEIKNVEKNQEVIEVDGKCKEIIFLTSLIQALNI